MAIINALLNEFDGEDIKAYLSRTYICSIKGVAYLDSYTTIHICSYHFLKLNRDLIKKYYKYGGFQSKSHFVLRLIDRLITRTKLQDDVTIAHYATIVKLAINLDKRFKRSLNYLEKAIKSFDDSLEEIEMKIDQCKSEKSETLEDSHENLIQFPNKKWKSFWDKQLQKTRHDDDKIKEINKNNHNKYYMLTYCKDLQQYLSFISLWSNICSDFSDNFFTNSAAELYFHVKSRIKKTM